MMSSSSARRYAKYTKSICQCSGNSRSRVREVRLMAVPITRLITYRVTKVLYRITPLSIFLPDKEISHDCIQIDFVCDVCGQEAWWTCEFSKKKKSIKKKYYRRVLGCTTFEPLDLRLKDIWKDFRSILPGPYNIFTNNCGHFARNFFDRIQQPRLPRDSAITR